MNKGFEDNSQIEILLSNEFNKYPELEIINIDVNIIQYNRIRMFIYFASIRTFVIDFIVDYDNYRFCFGVPWDENTEIGQKIMSISEKILIGIFNE